MKKINVHQITVPLEFKVACCIHKMGIAEVLQIFIDHVTIYDTLSKNFQEGFSEASHTLAHYFRSKEGRNIKNKAILNSWDLAEGNMSNIKILVDKKKRGWKTATKRNYSKFFVEDLFDSTKRFYAPTDILYLDEFSNLKLSKDFCVLCELYHCYPKEFLEYFMGSISLADTHVCEGMKDYTNFMYDFFFRMANGFGRSPAVYEDYTRFDFDFYERMIQIRLEIYIICDLQERADVLREFYLSYYQTINPN